MIAVAVKDHFNKEYSSHFLRHKYYGMRDKDRIDELSSSNKEKILILSDLHIPEHKEEMILDIVKNNSKVDTIILAGDILDCKSVSSWYDEEITILDYEMIMAHQLLSKIRNITNAKIVLLKGNHEQRVNTYYAKNAKVMGSAVVETEILYKLANGFTIKRDKLHKREEYAKIKDVVYCDGRTYTYGDLLVNHPSVYRKDYLKTVSIMYESVFKVKYPESNVLIIGHTHQLGMSFIEDGKVIIENGCTCNPMSYSDKDDRPFKLQQYGYTYLEMENGKVDINSIRLNYLGHDKIINEYYAK
jgi:predicted phosphodiesterase